ncbi:hypothetical protein DFJ73DRAFT_863830 [Zopfochytrium polystomum]|nr:hypothetical protein DFJ73DRAFT_863830 [Zopfochytrium polystomum]
MVRTGTVVVIGHDSALTLLDFVLIAAVALLAPSRTVFFWLMSFVFFPGEKFISFRGIGVSERIVKAFAFAALLVAASNFLLWATVFQLYALESADIQTAREGLRSMQPSSLCLCLLSR